MNFPLGAEQARPRARHRPRATPRPAWRRRSRRAESRCERNQHALRAQSDRDITFEFGVRDVEQLPCRCEAPDARGLIVADRRDPLPIRTEGSVEHLVAMPPEHAQAAAACRLVELDGIAGGGDEHARAFRTETDGQDRAAHRPRQLLPGIARPRDARDLARTRRSFPDHRRSWRPGFVLRNNATARRSWHPIPASRPRPPVTIFAPSAVNATWETSAECPAAGQCLRRSGCPKLARSCRRSPSRRADRRC